MDERIVNLARGWLGTPYIHQASVKGVGCDCLGLIRGIWRELHDVEPEPTPAYSPDWGEVRPGEPLLDAAARHLLAVGRDAPLAVGQVILFRMRTGAVAKHLAVVSQVGAMPRFIHAYTGHGVIDSPLTTPWQNRIVARFCFP